MSADPTPAAATHAVRPASTLRAALGTFVGTLRADRLTWFAGITAAVVLTVSRYHASTGEYRRLFGRATEASGGLFAAGARALFGEGDVSAWVAHATGPVAAHVYWFLASLLLFLVVPVAAALVAPGVRIRELGLGLGDWRFGLKACALLYAVMLPFVVGASFLPAFASAYPLASGAATSRAAFWTFELSYWAYFVGWEFVYRGLLCTALHPRLGGAAIVLQTIPFAVMHGGKPELEAYGSIVAGLALGALAVRTRSFWYGALLHAAIAFTMDVLALVQSGRWPPGG